jgi:hypothetical protein
MSIIYCLETSVSLYSQMHRHIPEGRNPQLRRFEKSKIRKEQFHCSYSKSYTSWRMQCRIGIKEELISHLVTRDITQQLCGMLPRSIKYASCGPTGVCVGASVHKNIVRHHVFKTLDTAICHIVCYSAALRAHQCAPGLIMCFHSANTVRNKFVSYLK